MKVTTRKITREVTRKVTTTIPVFDVDDGDYIIYDVEAENFIFHSADGELVEPIDWSAWTFSDPAKRSKFLRGLATLVDKTVNKN